MTKETGRREAWEWQDIASAPTDGTEILVWDGSERIAARWKQEESWVRDRYASNENREVYVREITGCWETYCGMVAYPQKWLPLPPAT